ncbi:MAG TPA: ATP-binding protein [Anaerolineales bacterium]|nr:ATP-binding protein [Anaerolineales bacterium]
MAILNTRILVTDDDLLSLKAMEHLFRSNGYEVFTAGSGEETLRQVEAQHPDLILLDVILPDIEGTEVCRRIKADPQTTDIFIILLSGVRTGSDEQAEGMEGGADGYIARPITNRELLARLQAYIRIKTAEQALERYSAHLEEIVAERTRELRDAQEKLIRQEKLAVLGQMAGSVGHELRNPLAVINSSIYYLKLVQPEAGEKIKEHHAIIERQLHIAEKIITDLLSFAHSVSAEREPVPVDRLVRATLERFPVPPAVELVLELPEDLPMVFADPRQIEQVLGNLVVNACQAMGAGGKLTISARQQRQMVSIAVKDTGMGITSENMQKLFEPLFTTKPKGIGLGLAVSKRLIEANDGKIEVLSQPGKGSTFTVSIPVKE